jgi:flavin-binding protein dodecin
MRRLSLPAQIGIVETRPERPCGRIESIDEEKAMAKKAASAEGVYRVIDVVGSSDTSWEDAARNAVETAGKSLRDLRIAEVVKLDVKIEGGKVLAYRARLALSFKYEG